MSFWVDPWATFEANDAVELALEQQHVTFELAGEPFYVIQRRWDLDEVVNTFSAWSQEAARYSTPIWRRGTDPDDEFPDASRCKAWMRLREATEDVELDRVESADNFIPGRAEFALRYRMKEVDAAGVRLPDVVFLVVNAPPHDGSGLVRIRYRPINPEADLERRQPGIASAPGFELSLRGWRQWLSPRSSFRDIPMPHVIPIAVAEEQRDLQMHPHGPLRVGPAEWWTSPPPFAPALTSGDLLVRRSNGARYEIGPLVYDWGFGFNHDDKPLLKVQKIQQVALLDANDPRYQIPIVRG